MTRFSEQVELLRNLMLRMKASCFHHKAYSCPSATDTTAQFESKAVALLVDAETN